MTAARGERIEPVAGLTSVIVPCVGPSATIRRCLAALFRHTRRPAWELIAVTRGTNDGITSYLAGLADAGVVRVDVVSDPALPGLRAAWHHGLATARGELVAFLAPTVVVTDAWIEQLAALAMSDPAIVLVGPMSPVAAVPQRAPGPDTDDPARIDAFARRWRAERLGRWFTAESIDGRCLMAKRRFLDGAEARRPVRAGGLRPRRLARRARRDGAKLAVAYDLYVHGDDGRPRPAPADLSASALGEGPGLTLPARQCRVSLTMIVRNEEGNLPACLASAADLFDEIVIVDTGSTDRTVEIARSFGARVFDFVWVDDFAAARNAALARATGEYAFWLDADDVLDPPERAKLAALLAGLMPGDEAAHVVRCACDPGPDGEGGQTVVDHVRLFPIREEFRWCYRVHEQIVPALRRGGVPVRWTDLVVRHTGYTDLALRERKLVRDAAILEAEAAERPDDPFVLFNLGAIAVERGTWQVALAYLRRSLAGSAPSDSITRKLHALISRCYQMLGEPEAALQACAAGLADDPDDAELTFRQAVIHRQLGNIEQAESCWRRVLTLRRPEQFSSVDQGIYGHLTRRNLAALARERGDRDEETRLWTAVLAECTDDREASSHLARLAAVPSGRGMDPCA